jgi:very-short-patch-repair endonuclease
LEINTKIFLLIVLNMKEIPYIQYNNSNKDYARFNRNNPTKAEKVIRDKILRKKQIWYLFLRQKMLWSFIADFYCSELLLVVEIDWSSHNQKEIYDINRTDFINDLWIIVIRYKNEDVLWNIDLVRYDLLNKLTKRQQHINLIHKNPPSW